MYLQRTFQTVNYAKADILMALASPLKKHPVFLKDGSCKAKTCKAHIAVVKFRSLYVTQNIIEYVGSNYISK